MKILIFSKKFLTFCITKHNQVNYGHPSGTCRMNDSPFSGVVDTVGKSHDISNLYISDASIFPSSAGVNPSLTVAALGLRAGYMFSKANT